MLLKAYSVYDVKSLSFSPPFFQPAHGSAVRMFADLAGDTNTTIGRHPADYALYCVGVFDDQNGELQPISPREHITDALQVLPKPNRDFFANVPDPGQTLAK